MRVRKACLFVLGVSLFACGSSGADGRDGQTSITTLTPEVPGARCVAGGTRIATGVDADGDGALSPAETKSEQVVCQGKDAAGAGTGAVAPLTKVVVEPKGANCASGGVRIDAGKDANGDGKLEGGEVSSTSYVCNGQDASKSGVAVTAFDGDYVVAQQTVPALTALQATLKAPGPGKVVAIASADVFCSGVSSTFACVSPPVGGELWVGLPTDAAPSASYSYFWLDPDVTEAMSRTEVFDVKAAGDVTIAIRARVPGIGNFGIFRRSLTLVFVPA
ncbi:MAG: hypothetical protein JST00_11690 [Deltaproteobacteria bacterium]|nr:hypothetical protein [Deltaproteobacteria bacterium]